MLNQDFDEEFFHEKGLYNEDLEALAKENLRSFFYDKLKICGGKISNAELLTKDNVLIAHKTPFSEAVFNYLHEHCLSKIPCPSTHKGDLTVPWTVHCLLEILQDMKNRCIPKNFHPGLTLLYFKFCLGIEIPSVEDCLRPDPMKEGCQEEEFCEEAA